MHAQPRFTGLVGKVLAVLAGLVLVAVGLLFSVVVFAILVSVGLVAWGYLWWKTRELRKQMRERPAGGHLIEGEVIRDVSADPETHAPPGGPVKPGER